jgi:hypothetical protein
MPSPSPVAFSVPTNNAGSLVQSGWDNAQGYASTAVTNANTFLAGIQTQATALSTLPVLTDALAATSKTIGAFVAPTSPSAPTDLVFAAQTAPTAPTFDAITAFDAGTVPTFTAALPVVTLPSSPAALVATLPTAPTLPNLTVPSAPTVTLPTVPTLLGISVPTSPLLALPTFTAVAPNSPLAAQYIFSFADTNYTSSLLTDLRTQLDAWITGASTGLAPAVEQAIWDRGRSRETTNSMRKGLEAIRSFAQRGFAKPPGMLSVELQDAAQGAQDANSALSRDVMIKQAEMEIENRKFAFGEAFKVEAELITYNNQIAQRAFDSAKYAQQVGIDIAQQAISRYAADVQAYSAKVDQWKAAIQAELTKLEKYRSDLEGQKLIGTLNEQNAQIYATQVTAARAVVDIFRAQVEAVNAQAGINKLQIDSFAAQVGAYAETVRAKAAEYEGYATNVRAEVSKVEVYKAQTDAYRGQVDGFKSLVDAKVAAKNMEIKLGRDVPLDLFKARTEIYRTQVSAEASRVGAVADIFGKQTQLYAAQVQGQTGRMGAEAEAYRSEVQYLQASAGVRIDVAKANIDKLVQKMSLLIEAAKSGAQVSAQMAASALSSVNLSGSISNSFSGSVSAALASSYSTDLSATDPRTSTNTSTNNGTTTSTNHNFTNQ